MKIEHLDAGTCFQHDGRTFMKVIGVGYSNQVVDLESGEVFGMPYEREVEPRAVTVTVHPKRIVAG